MRFPHTPYFSYSPNIDKISGLEKVQGLYLDGSSFIRKPTILTIKMDGSNVCLETDSVKVRNGLCAEHPSFDYLKAIHAEKIKKKLKSNLKIFGEWLYAKHSIHYTEDLALDDYLQVFQVYDIKRKVFWGWDDVQWICDKFGLSTVPELCEVHANTAYELKNIITEIGGDVINSGHEGVVLRTDEECMGIGPYNVLKNAVKYVRPNHVSSEVHWMAQKQVRNNLRPD